MRVNLPPPLSQQMAHGPVIGPINLIPSQIIVEHLCAVPFDFVWVDMEHGPNTIHDLGRAVTVCLDRGISPIVRVPEVADWAVKWVLDQGVRGIVFPFVDTVEQARRAIAASRYPPAGHRGYFPDVAANRWRTDPIDYFRRADDEIAVILQIESRQGVESVDRISRLEGWDVLFVGPMDLSSSYGKLGELDDPEIVAAIDRVREAAHGAGRYAGILAATPEAIGERVDEGFDFVVVNPDVSIIRDALGAYWAAIEPLLPQGRG
ncbi:MAG: HpcH/HpaI aldolase/citrate lyase family protein [Armatimonadota bacterium]